MRTSVRVQSLTFYSPGDVALVTLGMLDSQLESQGDPLDGAQRERP